MIQAEPIGLVNTLLPMAMIAALAVLLPWLLVKRNTRSHLDVAVTIWASAGLLLIVGAVLFALLYAARGHDVGAAFQDSAIGTTAFFLRISGYAAMLWVPILALMWFGMAQGVEKRRGEDAARH